MLYRERVSRRIARAANAPVTLIVAPGGFGKTAALAAYVDGLRTPAVRYEVAPTHRSLARFARALAAALEPTVPSVARSLAIAHERAAAAPDPAGVLATWLAEHLEGTERTIAIDDFHHCDGDRTIAQFLARAVRLTRRSVRWIFATRSVEDLPVAMWLANGDCELPIDEHVLRLTADEAERLAHAVAPRLDGATIRRLLDAVAGSPSAFAFAARTIDGGAPADAVLTSETCMERCVDAVLALLSPEERRMLVETAALPEIDEALFEAAGHADAPQLLASIRRKAPQVFEVANGRRRYHALAMEHVRNGLANGDREALAVADRRAAESLEGAGRLIDALSFRVQAHDHDELLGFVERHGFALVDAGCGESVSEAIDTLAAEAHETSAVVLALKAMAESRAGRFDTAEAWFRMALERGAPAGARAEIAYHYGSHLVRFYRPDAVPALRALAEDAEASTDLRAYALAALGPAHVFERDLDAARRAAEAALGLCAGTRRPHLRAKAHHQAAYVALYGGDARRAKDLANVALACAEEHGYYDVAAGALTVLYNVASDIDDDPAECVRLLNAVGDCAAKSGSLANHVLALAATLEIEMERGNEDAAAALDAKLRTLDVTSSNRAIHEIVLPVQAMRASWDGDFEGAHRILAGSADHQWSAERTALRHAEIAFYAAGAGLRDEASAAFSAAEATLATVERDDLRVQRTRILLAIVATLLGRGDDARALLDCAARGPLSDRLRALHAIAEALEKRRCGEVAQRDLLATFHDLERSALGGVARTIVSLPLGGFRASAAASAASAAAIHVTRRTAEPAFADGSLGGWFARERSTAPVAIAGGDAKAAAAVLDARRAEIVGQVVSANTLADQRTLAVDIVAESFLDRLIDALARGTYLDLLGWVDRTCESFREFPHVAAMLASACGAIANATGTRAPHEAALARELLSLERSIDGVASKPRRRAVRGTIAALDEVDRRIHELLATLEAADPATNDHSQAVSAWCARIARRLSLDDAEVTYVARCGLLHDVGKLKTPREILMAPRSLTSREWAILRGHPAAGERIVAAIDVLRPFANVVRAHHERLDGRGYPDGLAGSRIPLATRIVAVADAFNAMIARRPYRPARSPNEALAELALHRGTQFDPIVVEAMTETVRHAGQA